MMNVKQLIQNVKNKVVERTTLIKTIYDYTEEEIR